MPVPETTSGQHKKKRILLVDDHPVLRRGLAALVEVEPDFIVCGEAATCQEALDAFTGNKPDLVIVDIELEGRDGLDLVRELKSRYPEVPALVLSMYDESVYAERSLKAGAMGYLSKQQLDETVLIAMRTIVDGQIYMSDKLQTQLAHKFLGGRPHQSDSYVGTLSNRELQVFRMIGRGQSTRQVAKSLSLSIKTIESHIEHIKHKLTLESATELVHRATQWVESGGRGNNE